MALLAPARSSQIEGTPDALICHDFLSSAEADRVIENLESEAAWNPLVSFSHSGTAKGRVGSFQGVPLEASGAVPYLRCPSIAKQEILPLTPTVDAIRRRIAEVCEGVEVNIAKIQKYENGRSNIPPHADKIIDLAVGVPIYNARFGSTRIVLLMNKLDQNRTIAVPMPHNSLLVLGPRTNDEWTHSVPAAEAAERDATGASYSVIFRQSVTFMLPGTDFLFGERTRFKTIEALQAAIADASIDSMTRPDYEELRRLFQVENREPILLEEHYADFMARSF
jgi:alkylated DNA repair dioxygenase AlkB